MSASDPAPRALPANPSKEHLRKEAKRLAKEQALGLAAAQRRIARDHGASTWADLMRRVDEIRGVAPPSPLAVAASAGEVATVERLLAEGHAPDGAQSDDSPPLWRACASEAPVAARIAIARALLEAGANPRRDSAGETALHAAAARGPLALVETLIRGGALEWQPDRKHRSPLSAARRGHASDQAAIVELLERTVIRDPSFRAAVNAIHAGDATGLARLLDAEPRLLHERIVEPECYREAKRPQYFGDPKLFWFIANNPTLIKTMPRNIVDIADVMIARDVEQADLDYALELLMTSDPARDQGVQEPLIARLTKAGARPTATSIEMALAHRCIEPVNVLLAGGFAPDARIAAALGDLVTLARVLPATSAIDVQKAFGLAVINRQNKAAEMALDAGADVNGYLPVHAHSLPLHQAALDENMELMALLVARGAHLDVPDKLWNSTPLGWARHQGKAQAAAYLERVAAERNG